MRQCSNGECVIMRLLRNGEVDGMHQCYRKSFKLSVDIIKKKMKKSY